MNATIAALYIYPVKSCRGTALREATVAERGLAHDREWMIVDSGGRFLTQRELPRLALISPRLTATQLELAAPGLEPLQIPLEHQGPLRDVVVWKDSFAAIDQGEAAAEWLSTWLERAARLVRFDPGLRRYCNPAYAGDSGAHTGFADAYPLLVLSEGSIADLNSRMAEPLPVNRFRPNLLLSGIEAYDEDHIDTIEIGAVALKLVKPCTRCQITTTDQVTTRIGAEPLATLARYRMNEALGGVTFGVNAIVTRGVGESIVADASVPARYTLRF